jgi:hypothetical protein
VAFTGEVHNEAEEVPADQISSIGAKPGSTIFTEQVKGKSITELLDGILPKEQEVPEEVKAEEAERVKQRKKEMEYWSKKALAVQTSATDHWANVL